VTRPEMYIPDTIEVYHGDTYWTIFANTIRVSVATLRNSERGHQSPQGPARVLLALLERNPQIVEETLVYIDGAKLPFLSQTRIIGIFQRHLVSWKRH
jgi:hypothetical protein